MEYNWLSDDHLKLFMIKMNLYRFACEKQAKKNECEKLTKIWEDYLHRGKDSKGKTYFELYDHRGKDINDWDASEYVNLAYDKEYLDVVLEMRGLLRREWKEYG